MSQSRVNEEQIRQRAYEIWEASGKDGDPLTHWFEAKMELEKEAEARKEPEDPLVLAEVPVTDTSS